MIGSFTKNTFHTQLHLYATGLVFGTGTLPSVLSGEGICRLRCGRKALGKEGPKDLLRQHRGDGAEMDVTVLATGEENQEDGMNTDCDNAPHNIKGIHNQVQLVAVERRR